MKENIRFKIMIAAFFALIIFSSLGLLSNHLASYNCQKYYAGLCAKMISSHKAYKKGVKKVYFYYIPEFVQDRNFSNTIRIFEELGYEVEDNRGKPERYPMAYVSDPTNIFPFISRLSCGYSNGGCGCGYTVYILNLGKYSKAIYCTSQWSQ